ncbi:SDR family NAD(P)-dependent oxidoreductase [Pedobacter namyangjuensis]|uniref:SDR family NAD(P)-dependent oxidoreductase n=1 Tax=Pedobacter namyangjuensis TaxID=600626 RepID=UPI001965B4F6|nr:SDR family NAD(P)-dependent oxidoreductase [Pedobacter namyangjuensis]
MRTIVMTGATSGIGAAALKHFMALPDTNIFIGARAVGDHLGQGKQQLPLDLSSLESVRAFSTSIQKQLGDRKIDILVLNAGIRAADNKQRSAEGFELTFATNHLAHYLLARLLLSNMADGSKIVITTSDAHNPAVVHFGPKTLDIGALARPTEESPKGMAFYGATKLCNLLTAISLQDKLATQSDIGVIAFNPGLTGNTSLMGKQSVPLKLMVPIIRPLFQMIGIFKPAFFMGTAKRSGKALAELALGIAALPKGRIYASLVRGRLTFPNPSQLAQDKDAQDRLWKESAAMVGLDI